MDVRGLHGLCCRRSGPRYQRHHQMNDIIWRVIKRAQIPATKEPVSLIQQDGKRSDGTTLLPWARGKPMAWDVTVPDTYADSHIDQTARSMFSCKQGSSEQDCKVWRISASHIFLPVTVETAGKWNQSAIGLIQKLIDASLQSRRTQEKLCLFEGECGRLPGYIRCRVIPRRGRCFCLG